MSDDDYPDMAAWVASRPAVVQQAAARWPMGSYLIVKGAPFMLIGYAETAASDSTHDPLDLMLIISPVDATDYDDAVARSERICAKHLFA